MPTLDFDFRPLSNKEAAAIIADRTPMKRAAYDALLPELKARAITVSGLEDLRAVGAIRDAIAKVPQGGDWDEAKKAVEEQLAPYFSEKQSEIRATILLRYHTFQAYGAVQYRALQEEKDIFPFWQYRSTGDGKVRDSHAALDGLVLPADHPFWEDHFPPWQYNCRCQVVGLMQEEVDAIREEDANRDPAKRLVLEGPALEKLTTQGVLDRGPNEQIDVRSAYARAEGKAKDQAFRNRPGDFTLPLDAIRGKATEEDWAAFQATAAATEVTPGLSLWQWLLDGEKKRRKKARKGQP